MRQNSSYGWGSFWSFIFWCFLIFIIFWCFWSVPVGNGANEGASYNFWWWILVFLVAWWLCDIIWYIPTGVSADDTNLRLKRVFHSRNIPMNEIASARVFQINGKQKGVRISPAAFSAKWGTFTDPEIGDYVAYYSNPKKTVLITLKNGEKIVVGAKDPQALADYLNNRIEN